jgi:hypothetical protein
MAAHCTECNCERFYSVLYIQCRVGGTDEDMLWNESEEDGNVRRECEEDEGTGHEDVDGDTVW